MILAFNTYFYDGYSYTVCGVFEAWTSERVKFYVMSRSVLTHDGESDISCITKCMSYIDMSCVTSIIVYGFSWISDENGNQIAGFGKKVQNEVLRKYRHNISVIGISKSAPQFEIPSCREVLRGGSMSPLYITCTETEFTTHYAFHVKQMYGEKRMPDILKNVILKSHKFGRECKLSEINSERSRRMENIIPEDVKEKVASILNK